MKISHFIVGLLLASPIATTAKAQQSAEQRTAELPAAPIFTGVKFGTGLNYQWITADYPLPLTKSTFGTKKDEVGYRFHVGYDAQIGNALVIGSEAGLGRGGTTLTASSALGEYSLKPGWSWDASARAGVVTAPSVLMYGRLGYSWLRVREQTNFTALTSKDLDTSSTRRGFMFGAGIEAKVTQKIFVRGEYNRTNYRDGLKTSKVMLAVASAF